MSDSKPDTTPASVVLQSSPTPLSVEESEISSAAQLETESNENIGIVDEDLNINISSVDTEVVEASGENDLEEDIDQEVPVQMDDSEGGDLDVQISRKEEPDNTETKCTGENNTESTSEVAEIVEKNGKKVDIQDTNESELPLTAKDENKGGDDVQNTVQSSDLSATSNDDAATETEENIHGDDEQLETTNIPNMKAKPSETETTNAPNVKDEPTKTATAPPVGIGREILFTDEGWSQLWAAIPNRLCSFTAPVLRVEAGRFFWSSETYNKR